MVGAGGDLDDGEEGYMSPPPSWPESTARQLLSPRSRMASRLQSPTSSHFSLGSNDDELERAQARSAARARRKPVVLAPTIANPASDGDAGGRCGTLDRHQIMELLQNCIKLASENKINQKNTWKLGLIDHLSEAIHAQQPEDNDETNFQKASCTLEAGIKIYSMRVDSLHSEAYKVLGGINRAGRGEEGKENMGEGDHANTIEGDDHYKKETVRKISPLSTLESSFEALNLKKIDVAFVVDPLYHQTSAQFDEGGAKGLLLNNIGVYGGCRVLFDSFENPERSVFLETESCKPEVIDLSFVKDYVEKMMTHVPAANDITPTLREIVKHFDEDNCRPADVDSSTLIPDDNEGHFENNHIGTDEKVFDYECERPFNYEHDDQTNVIDDTAADTIQIHTNHEEEDFEYMFDGPDVDEELEKITGFLPLGLGLTLTSNAWAGPVYWKYKKIKGAEQTVSISEPEVTEKKSKDKDGSPDVEFVKSLGNEKTDIFAPPKNPKSLLLPANKAVKNITLPEDCHYRSESLVKLFLLPHILCIGKKERKFSSESREEDENFSPFQSWDNDPIANDQFDDGNAYSDIEDQGSLVSQPRQVNKVEIKYDKVSRQVDVHALKDALWSHIQESVPLSIEESEGKVSLRQVLRHFPNDCPAAPPTDISPHLFFICLLHLANERHLSLYGHPGLDELDIHIPFSAFVK